MTEKERPAASDFGIATAASVAVCLTLIGNLTAHNEDIIWRSDLIRALFALPLICLALGGVFYALRWRQAVFLLPPLTILFFSFNWVLNEVVLEAMLPVGERWHEQFPGIMLMYYFLPHLTALLLFIALFCYVLLFRVIEPRRLSLLLLAFVMATAAVTSPPVFRILLEGSDDKASLISAELQQQLERAEPVADLPDIFLIVPDRYPSARVLEESYGFDNGAFLENLAQRGFRMASNDMRANYPFTYLSLSSTFNLNLLPETFSVRSMVPSLHQSLLVRTVKRMGYEYVHLGGWWSGTRFAPQANQVYNGTYALEAKLTTFELRLVGMSPLLGLYRTVMGNWTGTASDADYYECHRLKRQLEHIRTLKRGERPLFVLFHAYIPHNPITMDREGNCIPPIRSPLTEENRHLDASAEDFDQQLQKLADSYNSYRRMFVGYMLHFNDEVLDIFDAQRAASSAAGRGLIFVLHGDEGPYTLSWLSHNLNDNEIRVKPFELPAETLRTKFGILGAIYAEGFPGGQLCAIHSPVNIWRSLLGGLLGLELPLLDDGQFSPPLSPPERDTPLLSIDEQLGARQRAPGPGCEQVQLASRSPSPQEEHRK